MPHFIILFYLCLLHSLVSDVLGAANSDVPIPAILSGSSCTHRAECEPGTQCVKLSFGASGKCIPVPDYSRDGRSGLFGICSGTRRCIDGTCIDGICQPSTLGRKCVYTPIFWRKACRKYSTCINGTCKYAAEGVPCETEWRFPKCLPGLRCVGKPRAPSGTPGKCVRISEGDRCLHGSECPHGLMCGTRAKCVKNAEGQYCLSDFWCPLGALCRKSTRSCTYKPVQKWDRLPVTTRARACKTELDCPVEDNMNVEIRTQCLNGVCLPRGLDKQCTEQYQCGEAAACVKGRCVEATRNTPCGNKLSCYYGMWCYWKDKTCQPRGIGRKCVTFSQCPPGMGCVSGTCTLGKPGSYCVAHSQCQPPLFCKGRTCTKIPDMEPPANI